MKKAREHARVKLNDHVIPALLVLSLVMVGAAAVVGKDVPVIMQSVRLDPAPSPTAAALPKLYHLGDTATRTGAYSLRVNSVRHDPVGQAPYLPGTDYQYFVLNVTIKNLGQKQLEIAPVVQTYLRDRSGNSYDMAPAPMDNPLEAGALQPGEEATGELSYNVLKTASDVRFIFDTGLTDVPNASFWLGN